METFRALLLQERDGQMEAGIQRLDLADLPHDDLTVRVAYSSLNYKDGLALLGKARVVRRYPMVPGIDLAGSTESGQQIIVTGWGLGETHWGGYTQLERVPPEWAVPLPPGMTLEQAMGLGTAGLTAMLALMSLEEQGLSPRQGPVLVTGASGGVGSLAVALLAHLGYQVAASTGRAESHQYLRRLGATQLLGRNELAAPSPRPLESGRWAGAIDTVGGTTLAGLLRQLLPGGSVASAGNAGGNELQTTVLPFILRGISILGIDSNYAPRERRVIAWERLAREFPLDLLATITRTVPLTRVLDLAPLILAGKIRGRVVVDVNESGANGSD